MMRWRRVAMWMSLLLMSSLLAAWAAPAEQNLVAAGDPVTLQPFRIHFEGDKARKTGDWPTYWTGNVWNNATTGEVFLSDEAVQGAKAIGLRNLVGPGSVQMYLWQKIKLPGGHAYQISFDYLTTGGAVGSFNYDGANIAAGQAALNDSGGAWKTITQRVEAPQDGDLGLQFQNYAVGTDKVLYLKHIRVVEAGEIPRSTAPAAPITPQVASNATSQQPELKPAAVANPLYRSIVAELQPLHPKLILLDNDSDAALAKFQRNSVEGRADFSIVAVEGMPFKQALRIDTVKKAQEWQTHIQSFTPEKISNGDTIYLTAWVRLIRRTDGQAVGAGRLYASQSRAGNNQDSSPLGQADFDIPQQWTRIHIPLASSRDLGPENIMKLMFTFGFTGQIVEFGGLTVIDLGPGIARESLPHAKLNLDYPGRALNATWRKAAAERIEKYRKGDLQVVVTDAHGKPLPNAQVRVNMTRHAFLFGTSFPGGMLPAEYQQIKPWNEDFMRTVGAAPADKKKLQEMLLKYFNCVTNSVTWAVWGGADPRISQNDITGILRWCEENNLPVFNSQAVYPSPEFTAPQANEQLFKQGKKAEFRQAVKDFVTLSATKFYPAIRSLQIANEIEGRPQYTDLLGHESVPDWFRWVKEANPKMGAEINGPYRLGESTVNSQHRGGAWPQSEGLQYYYDLISWLTKQGAPIDYIGFQNHSGIGAPGPEAVLKTLDQFSAFGKPLEVTEFEVTIQNGNDAEQRQYQADYVRDFFTAVFSHPQTHMIILQDFWQPAAWQYEGASAFWNKDWSLNPHGQQFINLVHNQWWTRTNGQTNNHGTYQMRGFLGDYEITVTAGGKNKTVKTSLPKNGQVLKVALD